METGVTVGDAMTKSPFYISPTTTLSNCAKHMADKHVGAMLIKDGNSLLGIVTEQDMVRKVIALEHDHKQMTVSDIMEKRLLTISPESDVSKALIRMRDANIRHLPVMENDTLLGLLTLKDILKIQPQLFDLIVDKFEVRGLAKQYSEKADGICPLCGNYTNNLVDNSGQLVCEDCKSNNN